jgi:hypothetical protein
MQNSASSINVSTAGCDNPARAAVESCHQIPRLRARSQNEIDHDIGLWLELREIAPVTEDVFGGQICLRFSAMKHTNGTAHCHKFTDEIRPDEAGAADYQYIHFSSLNKLQTAMLPGLAYPSGLFLPIKRPTA